MATWSSQSVQLVWFLLSSDGVKADAFFEAVSGEEPVDIQRNKIPSPTNPFLSVATGPLPWLRAQLQVQVQPGRLDLLVIGAENPHAPFALPVLETERVIEWLLERIDGQLSFPIVSRLALVVNLHQPTSSADEATDIILEKLNFDPGFRGFSDFNFQMNLRKHMPSHQLHVNRLLKYSVASFQRFFMPTNPMQIPSSSIPVASEEFGAMMSIDVNTVPDGSHIALNRQAPIFASMAEELIKLARSGKLASLTE
jgi:hypothetical protein